MLVVRIFGGLGNQMFQYAFYEFLKRNNKDVVIDISDFKVHNHHQGYELSRAFYIEEQFIENKKIKKWTKIKSSLVTRIMGKFGINVCSFDEFSELQFNCRVLDETIKRDVYFNGFWQDIYYVKQVESELKKKFCFPEINDERSKFFAEECKKKTIIGVHVRRGDYLKDKNFESVCGYEYYRKAISLMKEKYPHASFAFFSDDLNWCREKFGHEHENIYVDWNTGINSFRDMQLMSLCAHNIIANSTFSWWGAWLNSNINKTVIIPKQWTKTQDSHLICESNWIRL